MNTSSTPLLMSLKPQYADLVFGGQKKVELRRRSPKQMRGRDVFVYSTTPVRMLRGQFKVGKVWAGTPEEVWSLVSDKTGVEKPDFDTYYAGRNVAYAFEIVDALEYENPLTLDTLKRMFRNFVVPQSWRYVKPDEYKAFQDMEPMNETVEVNNGSHKFDTAVRYAH